MLVSFSFSATYNATILETSSNYITIQLALNDVSAGQTIQISAGTHSGTGNVGLVWPNVDNVTLQGVSSVDTILDAQQIIRHIQQDYALNWTVKDITLINGKSPSITDSGYNRGGSIYINVDNDGYSLTLNTVVISGNESYYGGAIAQVYNAFRVSKVVVMNSVIASNSAFDGGGLYYGTNILISSSVYGNTADNSGGGFMFGTNTLIDSNVYDNSAKYYGGGFKDAVNTLTNSNVYGNSAPNGGGFNGGTNTLIDSNVHDNSATYGGGLSGGTNILTNSNVYGNIANEEGGGFNYGTSTLTSSNVYGNSADFGGGFYEGTNILTSSEIYSNSANGGGGFYWGASTLTASSLYGNTAAIGGVFYYGTNMLTNSDVYGNSAASAGGGFYFGNNTLINVLAYNNSSSYGSVFNEGNNEIVNSTIVSNNGAIYYDDRESGGLNGELTAYNTIFVGDFDRGLNEAYFNTSFVDHCTFTDTDLPYAMNISNPRYGFTDSQFAASSNGDYRLNASSMAINNGSDALWNANSNNVTADIEGSVRIIGSSIDLGAYESAYINAFPILSVESAITANEGTFVSLNPVITDADSDTVNVSYEWFNPSGNLVASGNNNYMDYNSAGTWNVTVVADDGTVIVSENVSVLVSNVQTAVSIFETGLDYYTIQDALDIVSSGQTIQITAGTHSGTGNVGLIWPNVDNLTLQGVSSVDTILDAEQTTRHIQQDYALNWTVKDITLINGKSPSIINSGYNRGGSIYIRYSNVGHSLTLDTVIISGNQAYYGGAVGQPQDGISKVVVINSVIAKNSADMGGGLYFGTNTLTNTNIYGNSVGFAGGGFFNGVNTLTSCKVYGNTASAGGGFNYGTNTFINSSIYGNSANSGGGFIYGTNILTSSNVYDNSASSGGGFYYGINNFTSSKVYSNSASVHGGGFYDGTNTLTSSGVYGNSASNYGGGFVFGTNTLIDSNVYDNSASNGGGFYNTLGNTLISTKVYGNSASDKGGAFYRSVNTLINVLAYNNSATSGVVFYLGENKLVNSTIVSNLGVIYYDDDAGSGFRGELNAYNTIFVGDFDGGTPAYFNTAIVDYCAFTDTDLPSSMNISNPKSGFSSSQFADYASGDYRIISSSIAINNGSNVLWESNSNNVTTDIEGSVRTIGSLIDLGAYESAYINAFPILSVESAITANEGTVVSLNPVITDADGDTVTVSYEWFNPSGNLVASGNNNYMDYNSAGTWNVVVIADDGQVSVSENVLIDVSNVNRAPSVAFNMISMSVNEGETITFDWAASDPDGDSLIVTLEGWITTNNYTTTYTDSGWHYLTVNVSDGEYSAADLLSIYVNNTNRAPSVAFNMISMSVNEGETITFDWAASDPDGDSLIVTLEGWITTNNYTTTYTDSGWHYVTVNVSDGEYSAADLLSIYVNNINPVAFIVETSMNYTTIQDALDAVSEGQTIQVYSGTHTGTGNVGLAWPNVDNVTLQGVTSVDTILDGEQVNRHIQQDYIVDWTVQNIALINGKSPSITSSVPNRGGSIYINISESGHRLTLNTVIISGNQAYYGGAVGQLFNGISNVVVMNSVIAKNSATYGGGGFYAGTNTLTNSRIYSNSATTGGGGFYVGTNTLTSCDIYSNSAASGGGFIGGINTLTNSRLYGNSATDGGGFNYGTNTLINSSLYGNSAPDGGGFYYGTNTLTNSRIYSNSATYGGGFYQGTNTLTSSNVYGNSAASSGGGFYYGTNTFISSNVYSNSAASSGGGFMFGTNTLTNTNIYGNSGSSYGGGFYDGTNTLTSSEVYGNSSSYGGGFFQGTNTLINVLVYNNSASSQGAVFNKGNNEIVNSTIVSNNGAIYYDNYASGGNSGELNAYNTIFAGDFNSGTDAYFNTTTVDYCAFTDTTLPLEMNISNPRYGFTDSQFTASSNGDYRLNASSMAINNGSNDLWNANSNNVTTDIKGSVRTIGSFIDLGAYESAYINAFPIISVNSVITANEGTGVTIDPSTYDADVDTVTVSYEWFNPAGSSVASGNNYYMDYNSAGTWNVTVVADDGTISVSENVSIVVNNVQTVASILQTGLDYYTIQLALDAVNANQTIQISAGTYTGTGNVGLAWPNVENVTMRGVSSVDTILDGEDLNRIIKQDYAVSWKLEDLSLVRGKSPSITSSDSNRGGAVLANDNSRLTMDSCIVSGSRAYYGGAFYDGYKSISNSEINGNSADSGGAFYGGTNSINSSNVYNNIGGTYGGGFAWTSSTLINTNVHGNSAIHGGVFYQGINSISRSNIYANSAGLSGGVFYYGSTVLINTLIYSNSAISYGSVFYQGDNKLVNVTIVSNNNFIYYDGKSDGGTKGELEAYNSIFVGNFDQSFNSSYFNTTTLDYCVFTDSSLPSVMNTSNLISGFNSSQFVDYANGDFKIVSTSVVVNTGSDALWNANSDNINLDLNEDTRIVGRAIDLGAYETTHVNFLPVITLNVVSITVNEGTTVTLSPVITDADGDSLNVMYVWTSPTGGTTSGPAEASRYLNYDSAGTWNVFVGAYDGIATVTETVVIVVYDVPNIVLPSDEVIVTAQYVDETTGISINVTVSTGNVIEPAILSIETFPTISYQVAFAVTGDSQTGLSIVSYNFLQAVEVSLNSVASGLPVSINTYIEIEIGLSPNVSNTEDVRIYYYNPTSGQWENNGITMVMVYPNRAIFRTTHLTYFSAVSLALANQSPSITLNVDAITVNVAEVVTFDWVVSDPDGDTLNVTITGWITTNNYTTGYGDIGEHIITVSVTDGQATVNKTLRISVIGLTQTITNVVVWPNPFNPMNEGVNVRFTSSETGSGKLNIYSINGRLMRSIPVTSVFGTNTVVWDGKDNRGNMLSSELYVYLLNLNGGSGTTATKTGKIVIWK